MIFKKIAITKYNVCLYKDDCLAPFVSFGLFLGSAVI